MCASLKTMHTLKTRNISATFTSSYNNLDFNIKIYNGINNGATPSEKKTQDTATPHTKTTTTTTTTPPLSSFQQVLEYNSSNTIICDGYRRINAINTLAGCLFYDMGAEVQRNIENRLTEFLAVSF